MKSLLLLLFVLSSITSRGQSYSVIHVIGKIYLPEQKAYMKAGLRLEADTKMVFETQDAKAAVLSADRGRYVIEKQSGDNQVNGDLVFALASVVSPVRGRMSTRAGGINNQLDFEKKFGEQTFAWITDIIKVQLSSQFFPMSSEQFFFIRYSYQGQDINKKLMNIGDSLVIDKSQLFMLDGEPIDANETSAHQLYYYSATATESKLMSSFNFTIPEREEALGIYRSVDGEDQWSNTYDLFCALYGNCSLDDLKAFLHPEE